MPISANLLAQAIPSVLAAGGSGLVMNGLFLTANAQVPTGYVLSFANSAAVSTYFGGASAEAAVAPYYFNGYDGSTNKPAAMLFAQMPYSGAVAAFLQGGTSIATPAAIATITSGNLTVKIDNGVFVATAINFTGTTTYSGAATILQTALQAAVPTTASVTGSITTTVLTVTMVGSGALQPGYIIAGSGVTSNTKIVAQLTGSTGGVGTYTVSISQTASSTTITATPQLPTVSYNSTLGSFQIASGSTGVYSTIAFSTSGTGNGDVIDKFALSAADGAILSQGAAQATGSGIATAMNALVAIQPNFGGFLTIFEPTTADKVLFGAWNNTQNDQYVYSMWDTITAAAMTVVPDTTSALAQIKTANYSGTLGVYQDINTAAFALGCQASINFNQANSRITLFSRSQAGLAPVVTSTTIAQALITNGCFFYGIYSNPGNSFVLGNPGAISGPFAWWDSYINAAWLNNNLQTTAIQTMQANGNIPYNAKGYSIIRTSLTGGNPGVNTTGSQPQTVAPGPIQQAVNFGAINSGVLLSATQQAALVAFFGANVSGPLWQTGYYLQVKDPGPTVRAARGSPIINLAYMDGGSVQYISISSLNIQ